MSRYHITLETDAFLAYGFDHIEGPFYQLFESSQADSLIEERSYLFDRSFDCHALAQFLTNLVDAGALTPTSKFLHHIRRSWLDLPI